MRIFTALFYFLFFSLTAWGQTSGIRDSGVAGQQSCKTTFQQAAEYPTLHISPYVVVSSSLRTCPG